HQGRIHGGAVIADRQQNLRIIAKDERHRSDRAGLDHRTPRPCKQKSRIGAPTAAEKRVLTPGVRVGTAQFRITQCPYEHDQAACYPQHHVQGGTRCVLGNKRRKTEDADTDDHTHQYGDCIPGREPFGTQGLSLEPRIRCRRCRAPAHNRLPFQLVSMLPAGATSMLSPCTLPVKVRAESPSPTTSLIAAPFSEPDTGSAVACAVPAVPLIC